jgi:hypothetical protein
VGGWFIQGIMPAHPSMNNKEADPSTQTTFDFHTCHFTNKIFEHLPIQGRIFNSNVRKKFAYIACMLLALLNSQAIFSNFCSAPHFV